MSSFNDRYGSGPTHLAAHVVGLALIAFAIAQILQARGAINAVAWIVLAAIIHDLVFLPSYSLLDRVACTTTARMVPPFVNHLRFAAVVCGLLLIVYFPLILDLAPGNYVAATGEQPADYAARWLRITAAVMLAAVAAYAVRLAASRRRGRVDQLNDTLRPPGDEKPPGA